MVRRETARLLQQGPRARKVLLLHGRERLLLGHQRKSATRLGIFACTPKEPLRRAQIAAIERRERFLQRSVIAGVLDARRDFGVLWIRLLPGAQQRKVA